MLLTTLQNKNNMTVKPGRKPYLGTGKTGRLLPSVPSPAEGQTWVDSAVLALITSSYRTFLRSL